MIATIQLTLIQSELELEDELLRLRPERRDSELLEDDASDELATTGAAAGASGAGTGATLALPALSVVLAALALAAFFPVDLAFVLRAAFAFGPGASTSGSGPGGSGLPEVAAVASTQAFANLLSSSSSSRSSAGKSGKSASQISIRACGTSSCSGSAPCKLLRS